MSGSKIAQRLPCAVPGCGKFVFCREWCSSHYSRWLRHGDPLSGRTHNGEPKAFLELAFAYAGQECLFWPYATDGNGYAQVWESGRLTHVTPMVCERANGKAPTPLHRAAHSCDNGHLGCISPTHLHWATPLENQREMVERDRSCRGMRHPGRILSDEDVRTIRSAARVTSQAKLAAQYGVSPSNINAIITRRSWRHI